MATAITANINPHKGRSIPISNPTPNAIRTKAISLLFILFIGILRQSIFIIIYAASMSVFHNVDALVTISASTPAAGSAFPNLIP